MFLIIEYDESYYEEEVIISMRCNCHFNRFRDCGRFWDDLMFCRCRHRDCDDRRCRRDCDCDDCRRRRKHDRDCDRDERREW